MQIAYPLNLRRANNNKLVREINKIGEYRYQSLTNRVVESRNKLPKEAKSARTINSFIKLF
ncbi:hypothetical protein BpHYR1_020508 [Brachionus plicatilis]|uniref:Uncharacterized protein n=1 Tax=Brachionus plicatilis TaxID=10195 RepID=A0A3M7QBV0_BRAPC|nr:hypothetical protein BpHYR1_020508 [Brachionus plicatilis]